jgi:hypothetical protein
MFAIATTQCAERGRMIGWLLILVAAALILTCGAWIAGGKR